ncbi:MAG TPA: hypothetical protein PKW33_04625 [Anaerolineaceae bacterium]|nr:hypothetical protein [Anaerolineaceae bacterium]HPN50847.1 hypothetical protein [Anaerolineaceae bacterium]
MPLVPFHPDESTQLFTAGDFFLYFSNPLSMVYQPDLEADLRQNYRLLDAPMVRYTVGMALFLSGQKSQAVDWNWSLSWKDNDRAGALPAPQTLLASRFLISLFFPCSLILIFLIGRKMGGISTGLLAAFLFSSNALILLHTRRAMSEGGLVCFVLWFLFLLLHEKTPSWLLGLAAALCVNWKLSTAPLAAIPLLYLIWREHGHLPGRAKQAAIYLGCFLALHFLLNPVFWANPASVLVKAAEARQQLLTAQTRAMENASSGIMLASPAERAVGMIAHLFYAPPAIQDIGNYTLDLQEQTQNYLNNPLHSLLRSFAGGSIMLILFFTGAMLLVMRFIKQRQSSDLLMLLAFGLQMGSLIAAVTLPFQRYWLPLVPFTCLFSAFALSQTGKIALQAFQSRKRP